MEKNDLKGSLTEQNLLKAFAGESQAAARYRMYAKQARKDGFEKVACFFDETVHNELRHGKIYFEFLQGGMVEITASYPAGVIGTTLDNLKAAAAGENEEYSDMYPSFADVADAEGFPAIAAVMRNIAVAEKHHEERFLAFAAAIEAGTVFKSDKPRVWRCQNCGYVHEGLEAPESCPACAHPREYFQAL